MFKSVIVIRNILKSNIMAFVVNWVFCFDLFEKVKHFIETFLEVNEIHGISKIKKSIQLTKIACKIIEKIKCRRCFFLKSSVLFLVFLSVYFLLSNYFFG